jgi:exonuclease SbcD
MKIVFTSDIHLGLNNFGKINPNTGVHSTVEKFVSELNRTLDVLIEGKVDVWILPGDITHVRTPNNFVRQAFTSIIEKARQARIDVYCMLGNHDQLISHGSKNNMTELAVLDIEGFKVIEKSQTVIVRGKYVDTENGGKSYKGLQVVFLPWQKDSKDIIKDARRLIEGIDENYPAIIVGHFTVSGAATGTEKLFELYGEDTVPLKEVMSPKVQATFLGHIHKRQIFEKGKVRYIGSMDRIDFSERDESKGSTCLEINLKTKEYVITFLEGNPRVFKQFDFDDVEVLNETVYKDIKGAIVKIKISCTQEEKKKVDLDKLYVRLKSASYVTVQWDLEKSDSKKTNKEITQELSIGEALELWLQDQQQLESELKKLVKKEALKLLEEEKI